MQNSMHHRIGECEEHPVHRLQVFDKMCVCVCEQAAEAMQQNIQCSTAVYQLQGEGFEGLTEEKKSHFSQLQTLPRLLCF